ncbi:MAG: hypothetical protein ACXVED_11450, partial [Bacteroidia bacterium]
LIFIAYYLANQRSLALYESGVFCPLVTQELFEILAKRPDLFSVEAFDFTGIRADLFNRYLETLIGKVKEDSTLLDVVKPLAKFISQLPQYTLSTKNLDSQTIAVRDAFQNTQSPMKLLFEKLPQACGFPSSIGSDWNNNNPNDFLNELVRHLNILDKAYGKLLNNFKDQLASALKEPIDLSLADLRVALNKKYAGLEKYTSDLLGLKAFISKLQQTQETDKAWLESVAYFLGKSHPDKWRDNHETDAGHRLIYLSDRLLQLALAHSHQKERDADIQATVFRAVSLEDTKEQIAYLNPQLREQAKTMVDGLPKLKNAEKELKLAIIAELLSELD